MNRWLKATLSYLAATDDRNLLGFKTKDSPDVSFLEHLARVRSQEEPPLLALPLDEPERPECQDESEYEEDDQEPSSEELAAIAKERFRRRQALIYDADMDELERTAALQMAKRTYLNELNEIFK